MGIQQKRRLTGAAIIVMSSIIASRLTGFFREMLIPSKLGFGHIADAYYIAFLVPDLMYNLLVGGTIAAALIPVLSGYLENGQEEDGWKAVGTFINISFIAMIFVCILGMIFTPELVNIVAAGYGKQKPVELELSIRLTRILFPSVAFLMLAGLANGVLNSYHRFASSAYGPTVYNVGSALSILVFGGKSTENVELVAYGVMFSSIIYFIFQLVFALNNLKFYKFKIYVRHPGFIKLMKLAIPSLISSSIVQVNLIISSRFATFLTAGSVTALNVANKTWQMPLGIFAQGIGIAMLPTLSARLAVGESESYKSTLMSGLKTVLLLSIPSAVGLMVLKQPVIRTFFQITREVDENAVSMTADILMLFSVALVAQSIVAIMVRAFYANNDSKTPLYIGLSNVILNTLLSYAFMTFTSLGAAGIALAYSITSVVYAVLLLFILNRQMKGIYLERLGVFLCKVIPASIIMGIAVYLLDMLLPLGGGFKVISASAKALQLIHLTIETTAGAVVYFAVVLLMKVEEASYIYNTVAGRFRRIFGKKS